MAAPSKYAVALSKQPMGLWWVRLVDYPRSLGSLVCITRLSAGWGFSYYFLSCASKYFVACLLRCISILIFDFFDLAHTLLRLYCLLCCWGRYADVCTVINNGHDLGKAHMGDVLALGCPVNINGHVTGHLCLLSLAALCDCDTWKSTRDQCSICISWLCRYSDHSFFSLLVAQLASRINVFSIHATNHTLGNVMAVVANVDRLGWIFRLGCFLAFRAVVSCRLKVAWYFKESVCIVNMPTLLMRSFLHYASFMLAVYGGHASLWNKSTWYDEFYP